MSNNDIIKKGANFLLKGGTLLAEPCKICGNLQIEYKDNVICLNCQQSISQSHEKDVINPPSNNQKNFKLDLVDEKNQEKVMMKQSLQSEDEIKLFQQVSCKMNDKMMEIMELMDKENEKEQKTSLEILLLCLKVIKQLREM